MSPLQLDELERRTYRAYVDDGITDLLLGVFVLAFGLTMATDIDYMPAVLALLVVPIWTKLRRTVVEPRLGYAQLSSARVSRLQQGRRILKVMLALVAVVLWVVLLGDGVLVSQAREFRVLLPGVLLSIPMATSGRLLEAGRLYAYAGILLLTAGLAFAGWMSASSGVLVSGATIVIGGAALLVRFLKRYPLVLETGGPSV